MIFLAELNNTEIVIKSEDKRTPSRIIKAFIQFILRESLKFEKKVWKSVMSKTDLQFMFNFSELISIS